MPRFIIEEPKAAPRFQILEEESAAPKYEGRPVVQNPDGSWSHERSITIEADGQHMNIPTMFGGKTYTPDQAVEIMRKNKWVDPDTGKRVQTFKSQEEALSAAQAKEKAQQGEPSTFQKFARGIESVRQGITPDYPAARESLTKFPEESQRIAGVLQPVFGRASEAIAPYLAGARTAFSQLSAVTPKGVNEALEPFMSGAGKLVEYGVETAIPPFLREKYKGSGIERAIKEFAPDIGSLALFHGLSTMMNPRAMPLERMRMARPGEPTMAPEIPSLPEQPQVPPPVAAAPAAVETPVPPRAPAAALPPHPLDDLRFQQPSSFWADLDRPAVKPPARPTEASVEKGRQLATAYRRALRSEAQETTIEPPARAEPQPAVEKPPAIKPAEEDWAAIRARVAEQVAREREAREAKAAAQEPAPEPPKPTRTLKTVSPHVTVGKPTMGMEGAEAARPEISLTKKATETPAETAAEKLARLEAENKRLRGEVAELPPAMEEAPKAKVIRRRPGEEAKPPQAKPAAETPAEKTLDQMTEQMDPARSQRIYQMLPDIARLRKAGMSEGQIALEISNRERLGAGRADKPLTDAEISAMIREERKLEAETPKTPRREPPPVTEGVLQPAKVKTLADMTPEERAALEQRVGVKPTPAPEPTPAPPDISLTKQAKPEPPKAQIPLQERARQIQQEIINEGGSPISNARALEEARQERAAASKAADLEVQRAYERTGGESPEAIQARIDRLFPVERKPPEPRPKAERPPPTPDLWTREHPGRYTHPNGWIIEKGANGWDVINPQTRAVADTVPTLAKAKSVYAEKPPPTAQEQALSKPRFETPESKAAHAKVADWAAKERAKIDAMSPEERTAYFAKPGESGALQFPSGPELMERWHDLTRPIRMFRQTVAHHWTAGPVRAVIAAARDKGDNAARLAGRQISNDIRGDLRRTYGGQKDLAAQALSFVVEAKGDPGNLARFMAQIHDPASNARPSWARKASDAIEFASRHWNDLTRVARDYNQFTNEQLRAEHAAGIDTSARAGYVMHVHDLPEQSITTGYLIGQVGDTPAGFKHIRKHETFADAIASGLDPKSINATDLLESRISRGQKLINGRAWQDSLKTTIDPKSRLPIAEKPIVTKRPDGTTVTDAPDGYSLQRLGFQPIAIKNGYEGLFTALTNPSAFDQNLGGRSFMKALGTGKSITLLFDTFHLGRIAMWESLIKATNLKLPTPSYRRGLLLTDYTPAEITRMAAMGEIPQSWLRNLPQELNKTKLAIDSGYNIGGVTDALHQDLIHNLKGIGTYNKWLFDQFQRGAMREVWSMEFDKLQRARPNMSDVEVARQVSRDLNIRFGNLGRQGIFKSRTGQDLARSIALAPQWNEGLIKSEIGAVRQALQVPIDIARAGNFAIQGPIQPGSAALAQGRTIYTGVLARSVGTMALMQFVANQALNLATRGTPTWENPEEGMGAKISAWIPDAMGGPGFFLHPFGLAAETYHLINHSYEKTDDWRKTLMAYAKSRSSTMMRPVLTFVQNEDILGRTLKPGTVWGEMAKTAVTTPIAGSAVTQFGKELVTGEPSEAFPGQYQKQLMASVGVKTEQAPSPEQRIGALAKDFNRAAGKEASGIFYSSDYAPLSRALTIGNKSDAQDALETLLKTKGKDAIIKHYQTWPTHPFTGGYTSEGKFLKTLSPEQKQQYKRARQNRTEVAKQAIRLVRQQPKMAVNE